MSAWQKISAGPAQELPAIGMADAAAVGDVQGRLEGTVALRLDGVPIGIFARADLAANTLAMLRRVGVARPEARLA